VIALVRANFTSHLLHDFYRNHRGLIIVILAFSAEQNL
jgi:hypothetical protein